MAKDKQGFAKAWQIAPGVGGGGGLAYESDGDARRLAKGCKFRIFGLA